MGERKMITEMVSKTEEGLVNIIESSTIYDGISNLGGSVNSCADDLFYRAQNLFYKSKRATAILLVSAKLALLAIGGGASVCLLANCGGGGGGDSPYVNPYVEPNQQEEEIDTNNPYVEPNQQEEMSDANNPDFQPDPNYYVAGSSPPSEPDFRAKEETKEIKNILYSNNSEDFIRARDGNLYELPYKDNKTGILYFKDDAHLIELRPYMCYEVKSGKNIGGIICNFPRK